MNVYQSMTVRELHARYKLNNLPMNDDDIISLLFEKYLDREERLKEIINDIEIDSGKLVDNLKQTKYSIKRLNTFFKEI